ncbi:MAG: hypothetical protein WCK01_03060 [Candidatus Uhrbacteria bacterium]
MDTAPNLATTEVTKYETKSELENRFQWLIAAWVVLFVLLLASWFAFGALLLNESGAVRNDTQESTNRLDDRINEGTQLFQSRIDTRANITDVRIDQIMRENALLRSVLAALEMRVAQQESNCRVGCSIDK